MSAGLKAGLLQATASFLITLYLKFSVKKLSPRFTHRLPRLIIPPTLTVITTGAALVLIHSVLHTPEILHTIAPPIIVAALYCLYLSFKLDSASIEVQRKD